MPQESLKNKTVKGVGWSAVDSISQYGISFLVSIVLARLLGPEEYGLIGVLTIFINVFNSIVDSGFSDALIRQKNAKDIDYSTAFYTNLLLSIFLSAALFFCASPIAHFFKKPELLLLTRAMSVIVIINAFALVQRAILKKRIDFKTQTKITLIASSSSGAIGIAMAFSGLGVWALVGQQISCQLLISILLWVFNRWRPLFAFSMKSFKNMWNFGWKLLASSLIGTLWDEFYQVVIGRCYTPYTLGLYTRGKQFASLCSSNINSVVQRVSYPVLSEIQDDKDRLMISYRKIIKVTMLPTFVGMLGMAAIAKPMIYILLGEQWLPCVPFLQILCLQLILYPINALNINAIEVQGRSDIVLKLRVIKTLIATIPLVLGVLFDIYWMLWSSVLFGVVSYWLNAYYSRPLLGYPILEQIKDILPSFILAVLMALPVFCLSFLKLSAFIVLPVQLIVGASLVILLGEIFKLEEYMELKSIVLKIFKK